MIAILLTKITAAQNEVALSSHRLRGLYFPAVIFEVGSGFSLETIVSKSRADEGNNCACESFSLIGWVGVTVDTFFVGLFWTNMEKFTIMMPNFIYNIWMVFVTVNQSTFHNRV